MELTCVLQSICQNLFLGISLWIVLGNPTPTSILPQPIHIHIHNLISDNIYQYPYRRNKYPHQSRIRVHIHMPICIHITHIYMHPTSWKHIPTTIQCKKRTYPIPIYASTSSKRARIHICHILKYIYPCSSLLIKTHIDVHLTKETEIHVRFHMISEIPHPQVSQNNISFVRNHAHIYFVSDQSILISISGKPCPHTSLKPQDSI